MFTERFQSYKTILSFFFHIKIHYLRIKHQSRDIRQNSTINLNEME